MFVDEIYILVGGGVVVHWMENEIIDAAHTSEEPKKPTNTMSVTGLDFAGASLDRLGPPLASLAQERREFLQRGGKLLEGRFVVHSLS